MTTPDAPNNVSNNAPNNVSNNASIIVRSASSGTSSQRVTGEEKEKVVRVSDVSHTFYEGDPPTQVLFDNHLDLLRGELAIMTGRSGSGKTTLLTLIGGLRRVQEGSVMICDKELRGLDKDQMVKVRRRIGFIFQQHNLFDSLTARENVFMAMQLKQQVSPAGREHVDSLLRRLSLGQRLDFRPAELSGGQRQRVAIVRAVVNEPDLILADEPTASLDDAATRDVIELLKELRERTGCAILIVTHDDRILHAADRAIRMKGGKIVSDLNTRQVEEIIRFLRNYKLFREFSAAQMTNIVREVAYERHPAGTVIIRKGDPGDKFYVIKSGQVKVTDKESTVVDQAPITLGPGDYFGEVALLTKKPRNASVIATEQVELYSLDKDEFDAALGRSETFEEELRRVAYERQ